MTWSHHNPVRIFSGKLVESGLSDYLTGKSLLLIASRSLERNGMVAKLFSMANPDTTWTLRYVEPNPDLDSLDNLGLELRRHAFSGIVALGGGSVIDSAKALSILLTNSSNRPLHDHFRLNIPVNFSSTIPIYCIPTTSGTGAEVTPFATIWDASLKQKYSLSNSTLYPKMAILDGTITVSLPWKETLYSAMDAMSHALETLWNRDATPITISLALKALDLIVSNLERVKQGPSDILARSSILAAANLAGLAISQNRTALAHSISYPLTARFGVPHGLACSFTLSAIINMVQRRKSWPFAPSDETCKAIQKIIKDNKLRDLLLEYCSEDEVLGCIGEMFSPERVKNFILDVSTEDVATLLKNSLA